MHTRSFRHTAEEARFELAVPCDTVVFKTTALDHYATPPHCVRTIPTGYFTSGVGANEGISVLVAAAVELSTAAGAELTAGAGLDATVVWVTVVVVTFEFLFFRKKR